MVKILMPAAFILAFSLSATAAITESDHWDLEASSPLKPVSFVSDGTNVFALTHDGKIHKRDVNGAWSKIYDGPPAGESAIPTVDGTCTRGLNTDLPCRMTQPSFALFGGNFYMAVPYVMRHREHTHKYTWSYQEISIFKITPAGVGSIVLQIRGGRGGWYYPGGYKTGPKYSTVVDGYIFEDGGNLYWAGGGGKKMNPIDTTTTQVNWDAAWAGAHDPTEPGYLYETANGTDWTLKERRAADQYGREVHRAMPNGYRYNHLISFDSVLWDHYGYYTPGANDFDTVVKPATAGTKCTEFTFTSKLTSDTDGIPGLAGAAGAYKIHTEPWSRFGMAAGNIDGTDRLFRIGFTPKGDKNFICSITGTGAGDHWSDYESSNGGAAWDGPKHGGLIYWRTCAVVENQDDGATAAPYNEDLHDGLYATYSKKIGAGAYESGVFRYANIDAALDGTRDGWAWAKVETSATGDAREFTGPMFVQNNDPANASKGVILVSTSLGVHARSIGRYDDNGTPADATDDKNVMPQN